MSKLSFSEILQQHKDARKIVIHQTTKINILELLKDNDIVFFDDCLYSQYDFIIKNQTQLKQKNIICVLGLSTSIIRPNNRKPILDAYCAEYHDRFHNGDLTALDAYMSLDELRQLLEFDNIFIACHGDQHLELNKEEREIRKMYLFINDLHNATTWLKKNNLSTDIFVFPYAYDKIQTAYSVLRKSGYIHIFAGKNSQRSQIEKISI